MEKLVEELKAVIPFKNTTEIGDIVLIVGQNPQMIVYARVTSIERDQNKKDEWWNIGLTFLTVPLQKVVWTLRTAQMTGKEIFTMGGEKRFVQSVELEPLMAQDVNKGAKQTKKSRKTLKRVK